MIAYDAVVIGGGLYGTSVASYLVRARHQKRVALVERATDLLQHASRHNQARVHAGYHYPRNFTTAFRSRANFDRFVSEFREAVYRDYVSLYAIAQHGSFVSAEQFYRFCVSIGADIKEAPNELSRLFNPAQIERVFLTTEYAFDANALRTRARQQLTEDRVDLLLGTTVTQVSNQANGIGVTTTAQGQSTQLRANHVFNCTYSGLNTIWGGQKLLETGLKHEITEMAIVHVPPPLRTIGITVMDGPFFSCMPHPTVSGTHSLSHVSYTPHSHWNDNGSNPYERLAEYAGGSRAELMVRAAARYVPLLAETKVQGAFREVKTVLVRNEGDDGRPILFERHPDIPNCYSILGSKIDNIYDVLQVLDELPM